MKYSTIILALVASVLASPQASITSAPAAPIPSGLTPAVSCALSCSAGDVTCQAACLGNARPNASQAIDTNKCAAKCDQGDGSAAAATAFARCVDGCINSLFPSSQTAFAPGAAQGVSSAAARASGTASGLAASGSNQASATGASTQQTGAAEINSARIASAGLAGLLAIFAL
ncbi:hypothetical protein BKA63DRAFT_285870 [Paraphoma chrysanthemicola]|nr:hypothetical protein BKA63DRAFT_285870 [Paraphoma chrysanthemicola]